jgi:hypothetical protein
MALLLENGLGLCDWDSSYLEPASLSSEQEAAREAVSPTSVILSPMQICVHLWCKAKT